MERVVFGVFDDMRESDAALRDAAAESSCEGRCRLIMRSADRQPAEIARAQQRIPHGFTFGALVGAAIGFGLGALLGSPEGPALPAMFGGIAGSCFGAMIERWLSDWRIRTLVGRLGKGQVLLAVGAEGRRCERHVQSAFRQHGGHEWARHYLG